MNKHTSGPWRNESNFIVGPDYPEKGIIATVNSHRGDDSEANANLIAAAPELLEALEVILSAFTLQYHDARAYLDSQYIYHGDLQDLRVLEKVAKTAIAKAREYSPPSNHKGSHQCLTVRDMQSDSTTGWICRANDLGLKVTWRPGEFGSTIYLIKAAEGFVEVVQDTHRGRKLDVTGFNPAQLTIVAHLQDCGLICKEAK